MSNNNSKSKKCESNYSSAKNCKNKALNESGMENPKSKQSKNNASRDDYLDCNSSKSCKDSR